MSRSRRLAGITVFAVLLGLPVDVHANERDARTVVVRTAYGDDAYDVGVHARWPFGPVTGVPGQATWFAESWLDYWRARSDHSGARDLVDVSLVAGLRWRPAAGAFIDVSFGPHVLSRSRLGDRRFGIAMQIGSHLGAGVGFGDQRRHEVAAYVEHLSNGSVAQPNNGMTFFGAEYRDALH